MQEAWSALSAAPRVISGADAPIPYAPVLEDAYQPGVEAIAASARALAGRPAKQADGVTSTTKEA